MKVDINHVCSLLLALVGLNLSQGYPYSRYGRRSGRPLSRLFGSPFPITRTRYDSDTRRPLSRPFSIPGFRAFSDSGNNNQGISNMGFDLGFGGSALMDPIAGMGDSLMGLNGATVSIIDGGDLGFAAQSRSPLSRSANMQLDPSIFGGQNIQLEFVDSGTGQFLPAAGSRGLSSMDMNSALNQPLDISSFGGGLGTNIQMANPTQTQFSATQLGDGISSIQFIDDLGNGGASQISLSNQGLNSIGLGAGGQMGLGSGSVQIDSNQLGLGNSQFQSGSAATLGIGSDGLGISVNQLGVGSNQFQTGQSQMGSTQLDAGRLQGNQLGLNDLGTVGLGGNQVLLDARQLQLGTGQGDYNAGQMGLDGSKQILTTGQLSPGMNNLGLGPSQLDVNGNVQASLGMVQPTSASLGNAQFMGTSDGASLGNVQFLGTSDGASLGNAQFLGTSDGASLGNAQFLGTSDGASLGNAQFLGTSDGASLGNAQFLGTSDGASLGNAQFLGTSDGASLGNAQFLGTSDGASLGNVQFLGPSDGLSNTIITSQDSNGGGQFFSPNDGGEQTIITQSQGAGGMTSQLGPSILSQISQAQLTSGT